MAPGAEGHRRASRGLRKVLVDRFERKFVSKTETSSKNERREPMKRFLVLATLSGLFCGIGLLSLSRAQAPAENVAQDAVPAAQAQYGPTVQVERDTATGKIIRTYAVPGVGPGMSARGEIAQLVNQLRDATDEGKKGELTKKLE